MYVNTYPSATHKSFSSDLKKNSMGYNAM